jgi:hypothetical protein
MADEDEITDRLFIDQALIPADVCSRSDIEQINDMLTRLAARKTDQIVLQEPDSGFRLSNHIRAYCQTFVRRSLCLFESAYSLFFTQNGLVSLMCVRAIYETVASFCYFEKELQAKLAAGEDSEAINTFLKYRAHQTRITELLQAHGKDVQAVSVLTQVQKLKAIRPEVWEEYEFLSDYAHPNGLGAYRYFASDADANDVVTFSDGGQDPCGDLGWIIVGCKMLKHFEAALDRIDAALPALSQKGREQSPLLGKGPETTQPPST